MKILGLDIGGANIKATLVKKKGVKHKIVWSKTIPLELYRDRDRLAPELASIKNEAKAEAVALTMTGELCDCFVDRDDGVRWIMRQVNGVFREEPVKLINSDGEMISPSKAQLLPGSVASANWAATVHWAAQNGLDKGVVVDIGSTTTDILPVKKGKPAVRGRNDTSRSMEGELVYTGVLRTHAAIAAPRIAVRGMEMDSCPEYFAITADAHLLLGDITESEYTCPTPDGGPKTKKASAKRLCRMALADLRELGMGQAAKIAKRISDNQKERLADAAERIANREKFGKKAELLIIGSGAGVYGKAIEKRLEMKPLAKLGGIKADQISPAACVAMLWPRS